MRIRGPSQGPALIRPAPSLLVLLLLVVAACSTSDADQATVPGEAAWSVAPLTDVRSGESFRVADLRGKLVVIEPMAIWCTTCRAQQREAAAALERLPSDEVVYISLDVDPNEHPADLARYADEEAFGWRFVVASRDVARSLADAFGPQVLSPPATPSIVVTPDGSVQQASFGIKPADELYDELAEHLP